MRRTFVIMMSVSLLLPVCGAAEQAPLKEQKAKDSYSVGYEFGSSLRQREVEVDVDILLSAVREVELVSIGAGSSPAATSPTPTQARPTAKPSS